MEFLQKIETANENLLWNIPEQPMGTANVIGGNLQSFSTPVKIAEFLNTKCKIQTVNLILPDTLRNKLPDLPNIVFLASTDSGSLASEEEIVSTMNDADYNLIIGDLSKNSITGKAIAEACKKTGKPVLITRDAVDFLAENVSESVLMNDNLVLMASMVQLQKLLRAVYYPRMITLTAPFTNVVETLHKFTLSYPVSLITLHNGQILVAKNGNVAASGLNNTSFSPISFWSGELAAKIVALNLFNPNNFVEATMSAIISNQF